MGTNTGGHSHVVASVGFLYQNPQGWHIMLMDASILTCAFCFLSQNPPGLPLTTGHYVDGCINSNLCILFHWLGVAAPVWQVGCGLRRVCELPGVPAGPIPAWWTRHSLYPYPAHPVTLHTQTETTLLCQHGGSHSDTCFCFYRIRHLLKLRHWWRRVRTDTLVIYWKSILTDRGFIFNKLI